MLTPMDDYPIHQTPLPVAHPGSGDPNHYDRYFFNAYDDDFYVGVAMGYYPNRGIIDGAVSVVHDGVQRSVFVSGRAPLDPAVTKIGPLELQVLEPLRTTRIVLDAEKWGIGADMTFSARTVALEEERQTTHEAGRLVMDTTRMTQWGTWSGGIVTPTGRIDFDARTPYGTKDRSWGVRPVGAQAPSAPQVKIPQIFFLWAPLNFDDRCIHYMIFEDADGNRWAETGAELEILAGADAPTWGAEHAITRLDPGDHDLDWVPGLRRANAAALTLARRDGRIERIELERLLTFRMRGIGYFHPKFAHGRWIDDLAVEGEVHGVDELDTADPACVDVQQVVRATAGEATGIGVLEQLALGPHAPSGFTGFADGYRKGATRGLRRSPER